MAHSAKCLPQKCEDLNSDFKIPQTKQGNVYYVCNLSTEGWPQRSGYLKLLSISLVKLVSSSLDEKHYLKV